MKKKLEFNEQELNILFLALQKQPFEMVNDLIRNLVGQLQSQQEAAPAAPAEEVKDAA